MQQREKILAAIVGALFVVFVLVYGVTRALGRKVSDEWTVPLCATHHRSLHSVGDEERWWKEKGIDATAHAVRLWWETRHPTPECVRTSPS